MTDYKDDKPNNQEEKSFKKQILAEMEEANRLRQQREKELYQKELEAKEVARKEAAIQAEKQRLEEEAQTALAYNKIDPSVDDKEITEVLESISHSFTHPDDVDLEKDSQDTEVSEEPVVKEKLVETSYESENYQDSMAEHASEPVDDVNFQDEENTKDTDTVSSSPDPVDVKTLPQEENDETKLVSKNNSRKQRKRQKADSLAKRIALILITAIVLVLLVTGFFGYRYVSSSVSALDSTSTEYVTVDIPEGSSNKYIGQILEDAGVIKDATVFNYYTKFKNYSNLQSGYYNLQASMDLETICKLLQQGGTAEPEEPALGKILIPEGYTIEQIAQAVATNSAAESGKDSSTPFTAEEFLSVVKDETFISKMVEKYPTLLADLPSSDEAVYQLEGYLFPATYNYYEETTVEDLVEQMIATMDSYMQNYYDTISANGMTINEVLTLSSLVEKEGSSDEDRRNIASVFYNRLNDGIALGSNIAVLYAQGTLGEETTLEEDANIDTSIDSPYNDYANTGLMPGPVDSPSLSAIEATVNPNSTDYYYFVADTTTGTVYFAETIEEHNQNVAKYVNSQIESSSSSE